jgi:two-component system, cell cycle sensor histidine kinase and response regulator CckA
MNILYVEDNSSDADLLKRALSRTTPRITLEWVSTCKEALAKLEICTPDRPLYDLLLTDMELPDGEGISLIPFIRGRNLPIAVVVITGMRSEEAAVAALKAGISDYVAKQGDYLSRLPNILETALHRSRTETTPHSRPLRVLYAEHDASDIDITKLHFSQHAPYIHLETVSSTDDVLKKMPSLGNNVKDVGNICDVLLVHHHLPYINGIELLKELLEVRCLDLPVVIITGHGNEESVIQTFHLGAMDYVIKHPGYVQELIRVLENAFHKTQLAREQKALKASEEYFRSLIENASDIIMVIDRDGSIRYASPSSERSLGFTPEEFTKANALSFLHPDDHVSALDAIAKTTAQPGRTGPTIELRVRHKDGSWRYMEVIGKGLKDISGLTIVAVNMRDITQRKEAEDKLFESEERYRTAIEHSNDGVALVRGDEHIYVNHKFLDIFGYDKPEEILGTSTYLIAHPSDRPMLIEYNRKRQRGKAVPSQYTFKGIKRDGTILYIEVSAAPVHLKGEPVTLAFLRDISARVNAEQKIVESEQSLQAILRASPIGIGRVKNRVFDWVNEYMCEMSGYTFEELEGKSTRLLHESDEEFEAVGKSLNQTGQAEHKMLRKDGTIRDVLIKISPVNSPSHIFTIVDMTEQKKAERALRKSEVLYRTLVEKSSEILFLGNADRKRTYVSPNITKILGYTVEEFLAQSRADFIHPDSVSIGESARSWVLEHPGESVTFEAMNRHKDGRWRWFECTARNLLEEPDINTMVLNLRDITERKEAEAALFESETKYRTIVENSLVGFYIIQNDLFRFVNKRFCDIFGYTYEEIVDKLSPIDSAYTEDRKIVKENIHKRLTGLADNIEYEFRALRKDYQIINLKVLGSFTLYNGQPAITGTVIDITREKTLESQLRQAQKMEAIGTLAGGVAHDFNNILTALTGYGTLLQLKLDKGNPLQHYVDQILSASMKGANLTRSLLAFSRKQPITLIPINLNNIIKGTEKLLKRLLTEDIILKTFLTSDNIMIMADPTQVDQILFNLVTNARDAMPKGGSLTIATKTIVLDKEFVAIHGFGQPGKYALLSISDTGTGMDAAVKEHIFDPFFTTKEVGKGTGLGLSTIYGIVKQHNGYVTVYSEPGIGTTIRIYIPLTGAITEANASSSESIRGGKETILVAEDDKEVRNLIKNILVEFGYTIIEAKDGEDATNKFDKHKNIDLLILDSVMPKMNGKAVYDEISATNPHIKVIFTSGYTRDIILDKGIEDKKFDFIPKPLSPKELLEKVREVLDRRQ